MPPMNILETDTSVMMPNRIMGMEGGMMIPSVPPEQITPTAKLRE